MSSDPDFLNEGKIHYSSERVFEFTKDNIKEKYGNLSADDRRYLVSLPALAVAEFPNQQPGWLVKITSIDLVTDGCIVRFKKETLQPPIQFSRLQDQQNHLGISNPETFRHHLALKDVDLYSVLEVSKPFWYLFRQFYLSIEKFVTLPIWKGISGIWAVFLILISVGGYFTFRPSIDNPPEKPLVEKEVTETNTNFQTESSIHDLTDSKRIISNLDTNTKKLTTIVEQIVKDKNQFDYLTGKTPQNNFAIFLQKYYGLDGNSALGDALVKDMLHKEVEWAVKVVEVIPSEEDTKKTFIIFEVNDPVCEQEGCPKGFSSESISGYDSITGIPSIVKKGDFIHIRGKMYRFSNVDGKPNVSLRRRMFIVPDKTRYFDKN